MAVAAQTAGWDQPSRRRRLRYRVQSPLDVTVLRSGIPDTLPGRSLNLGEGGVGAVLAGELLPGEAVGVEIQLPLAAEPMRTRALVRHYDKLLYGMEFVGLSAEQHAAIRDWAGKAKAEVEPGVRPRVAMDEHLVLPPGGLGDNEALRVQGRRGRRWVFALIVAGVFLAGLGWRWHRGWQELESGLRRNEKTSARPQTHVPAEVMEKLVTHRVDPDYPAAARQEKLRGVIVLNVVVARDGTVASMNPQNGPEILSQAAMDALRWWRFEPYRVDGQPVAVETTVAVEFKP